MAESFSSAKTGPICGFYNMKIIHDPKTLMEKRLLMLQNSDNPIGTLEKPKK